MAALGVARLNETGADLVVTSLDDVAVNALSEARLDRATIRATAVRRFSRDRMVDAYVAVYHRVLARGR